MYTRLPFFITYFPPRLPVWTFRTPTLVLVRAVRVVRWEVPRLPLPNIVSVDFETTPIPMIVGRVVVIIVSAPAILVTSCSSSDYPAFFLLDFAFLALGLDAFTAFTSTLGL